jgi:hypothetical protein
VRQGKNKESFLKIKYKGYIIKVFPKKILPNAIRNTQATRV